jgi:hypothetical protein
MDLWRSRARAGLMDVIDYLIDDCYETQYFETTAGIL